MIASPKSSDLEVRTTMSPDWVVSSEMGLQDALYIMFGQKAYINDI